MISILIGLLVVILLAISQACTEKLKFHFGKSIFHNLNPNFWDPSISWKRKYRDKFWLWRKFPWLNDTIFVWTTDAYHIFRLTTILIFIIGILIVDITTLKLLWFIVYFIVYGSVFELFFSNLLTRKN